MVSRGEESEENKKGIKENDMFTHSCFIRANSKYLVMKLHDIGYYTYNPSDYEDAPSDWCTVTRAEDGCAGIWCNPPKGEALCCRIDCGTNEDLFLAIAALRDDTDKNQWFVHNDTGLFMECIYDEFHFFCFNPFDALDYKDKKEEWHKATVEELIEHFSKDKQDNQ